MIKNIGFAITGSFCTHEKILDCIKNLKAKGYNIHPIVTNKVKLTDTRFGKAKDFIINLETICENKVIDNITSAEPLGPKKIIDALVVAPCTGNTISKLANAITDNAVTMTAKALMRNNKPVIIGISTNDALGLNAKNIAQLFNCKGIYFIPFMQDDFINKPKSLVANFDLIEETLINAENNNQIQPMILSNQTNNKCSN